MLDKKESVWVSVPVCAPVCVCVQESIAVISIKYQKQMEKDSTPFVESIECSLRRNGKPFKLNLMNSFICGNEYMQNLYKS